MPPPRKKDRLRGSLSPVREQFPPTGTLYGGQVELSGKSRPNEGAKTVPGGGGSGTVCRLRPWGNGGQWGCLVPGRRRTGCPPGQRACPGAKTSPARAGDCAQAAPHGGMAGNGSVWYREGTALGTRRGRGHARAQKQPPAGAGGCLDAGYGRYLPRAIRVIWMHRVGSTARPRIMPS